MRRIFRVRVLLVVILAAAVAAGVSTALGQKRRLQSMTPEDRRSYLGGKIGDKMSEEQIDQIAAAISAKLDGTTASDATDDTDAASEDDAASDDGDASEDDDTAGDDGDAGSGDDSDTDSDS